MFDYLLTAISVIFLIICIFTLLTILVMGAIVLISGTDVDLDVYDEEQLNKERSKKWQKP